MKRIASISVVLLFAAGCYDRTEPAPVAQQPAQPAYVDAQAQPDYVEVNEAPPTQVIVEQRPESPGPDFVWVDGYYGWDGGRYAWTSGRWQRPPNGFSIWVGPSYDREHHRYAPGRWQAGNRPQAHDAKPDRH